MSPPATVAEIMTPMPVAVAGASPVDAAIALMRERGVSSVLVRPDARGAWGIMTQRDVLARIVHANRSPARVTVDEIATRPLVTVADDTSIPDCANRMLEANIRRVAVVRDGEPIGIVSDTDIFRTVEEHGWDGGD